MYLQGLWKYLTANYQIIFGHLCKILTLISFTIKNGRTVIKLITQVHSFKEIF